MRWTTEQVRAMRDHVGMTQAEFASAIGCSPTAVYYWEAGKTRPSKVMSRRISDVFGQQVAA